MSGLIKYEAARHALAVCKQVDEVKEWADKAAAMQAYGRMAQDKGLEVDAAEIRIRAERRLGELIAAQKAGPGLNNGNRYGGSSKEPPLPTLAEVGIDKKLSSRAQNIAAVPQEEFEQEIGDWRERVTAEGARVSARLDSKGAKARQEPPPPDSASDELEMLRDQLEDLRLMCREQGELLATFEADDTGAELVKQSKLAQHYRREIGQEQDKNVRLLKERDMLAKWQSEAVRAIGADGPKSALAEIRRAFVKP